METKVLSLIPPELLKVTHMECAPSFAELAELAAVDGVALRVPSVWDDGRLVAAAVCYVPVRRHHGITVSVYALFGGMLHDYIYVYARDAASLSLLLQTMCQDAKGLGCDLVVLDSIVTDVPVPSSLSAISEKKIFVARHDPNGWSALYKRRSVTRFIKDARKVGPYAVTVYDGNVPQEMVAEVAALHRFRWAFAGASSAFASNPRRCEEYLCHAANKHYLRVTLGDELLCCHYGMRYGNTLLWHTPLINPKYMTLSPLRILLAETARHCEAVGVERLDFGLGDESYKDSYCADVRTTYAYGKALTLKGMAARMMGLATRCGAKTLVSRSKAILRAIRDFVSRCITRIALYVGEGASDGPSDASFFVADDYRAFFDFMVAHGEQVKAWHWDRFRHDPTCRFLALATASQILSYGWSSQAESFHVGETGKTLSLNGYVMLYDFVTPERLRRRGYYTRLLKAILCQPGHYLIFAKTSNIASRTAIQHAGFTEVPMVPPPGKTDA